MKLKDLIFQDEYISSDINFDKQISSLATSIEDIKDDCLYIAENKNKIPNFDNAKTKPAAVVIGDTGSVSCNIPKIKVSDPRKMSALIHSRFWEIDYSKLTVIGVTGTNGKTTTATIIYNILKDHIKKVGFIGTGKIEISGDRVSEKNYSMTTPTPKRLYKAMKKMQECGCTHVIMEVSSHALVQERVAPIPFEYAVFTNLSSEHMDYHLNMEDYYQAKKKLFLSAEKIIINIDDPYGRRLAKEVNKEKITAGVLYRGDVFVTEPTDLGFDGITYYYNGGGFSFKAILKLSGIYNIYNSLLAMALCIDLGIAPCKVKESMKKITSIPGRFEIIKNKITVIIDYAHTEEAFFSFLESLYSNKGSSSLTVVFGCGGERDKTKRPKMAAAAERFADKIIVTSDNPRSESPEEIIRDISEGFSKNAYEICIDRETAIKKAINEASPSDIVAIIGKGAEEYNIDKDGYHPFSERKIAEEALKIKT